MHIKISLEKTTEYLFYLVVFLLPVQTIWIWREPFVNGYKWEYGTVGIYGVDILILLMLALNLAEYIKNFEFRISNFESIFNSLILKFRNSDLIQNSKFKIKDLNYNFLLSSFFFLLLWSFISIAWSPDKILSLYFSFKLFLAIGLFWTAQKINFDWKKLIAILILAGALQGALATGQFLFQRDFASTLLGTSLHLPAQGGSSVIEAADGRWLRAYGTFTHPNILGGYLAILLLIVFKGQEVRDGRQETRNREQKTRNFQILNFKFKKHILRCFLFYTLYFLIFSGLVVSFSRSAWLVFAVGFVGMFLAQKERRKELAKISFIFAGILAIWISAFSPLFFSRANGQTRLEKKSFSDRSEYVLQAKKTIKENFWLGVGAGNYTKYNTDWKINPSPTLPLEGAGDIKIWQIQPVHNIFLLVWSELGFVGLVLFLLFLLLIIIKIFQRDKFLSLFYCLIVLLLFTSDHWLWTSHFGIIFFFLILGLFTKKENSPATLNT